MPMPTGRSRLAVEDSDVDPAGVELRDHRRRGRALEILHPRQVGSRPPPDREPDLLARVLRSSL